MGLIDTHTWIPTQSFNQTILRKRGGGLCIEGEKEKRDVNEGDIKERKFVEGRMK